MAVERRLILWEARAARITLVGGAAWVAVVLAIATALAPENEMAVLAWFTVTGGIAIAPVIFLTLRLRVPVYVRATRMGLEIRRDQRPPPVEGLLPWPDLDLVWSPDDDNGNLVIKRRGRATLLLADFEDGALAAMLREIGRFGIPVRSATWQPPSRSKRAWARPQGERTSPQ